MCGLGVGQDDLDSHGGGNPYISSHESSEMVSVYVAGEAWGWMNGN